MKSPHGQQWNMMVTENVGHVKELVIFRREENCSSGKRWKLLSSAMQSKSTTTTIETSSSSSSESLKKAGTLELNEKQQNASASSTSMARKFEAEKFDDLMGITEMDYSPAKRKTPIHN
ncbi:hypothetical protein Dimus_034299 [Dionaea muscipula]